MTKYTMIGAGISFLLSASAVTPVFAQGIGADLNAGTQIETKIPASMGVGLTGSVSSGSSVSAGAMQSSATSTGITATSSNGFGLLLIDRNALGDSSSTTAVPITEPGSVSTGSELTSYAKTSMQEDIHINSMSSSADSVSMNYDTNVKLLGFIPLTVPARAEITSSGAVAISYPWYGFLLVKDDASLQDDIKGRVAAVFGGETANGLPGIPNTGVVSTTTASRLSVRMQAMLLDQIRVAMKDDLEATASTNASTTASY